MNKTELTAKIAEGAGLTKVDAKKALDATLDAITAAVKAGDKVALIGETAVGLMSGVVKKLFKNRKKYKYESEEDDDE